MLELELEQCRTSYQREYQRTQERLTLVEQENLDLCKSIDENTIDDAMKQQISSVINENLVNLLFSSVQEEENIRLLSSGTSSTNSNESRRDQKTPTSD